MPKVTILGVAGDPKVRFRIVPPLQLWVNPCSSPPPTPPSILMELWCGGLAPSFGKMIWVLILQVLFGGRTRTPPPLLFSAIRLVFKARPLSLPPDLEEFAAVCAQVSVTPPPVTLVSVKPVPL